MQRPHLLFVTGKLAEPALRTVLPALARDADFDYDVAVLPITVAALLHSDWLQRKLAVPPQVDRVIVPGWCQGDLQTLTDRWQVPFERGPKDLLDLPEFFGRAGRALPEFDEYSIDILAEINHAPRLSFQEILDRATRHRQDGANLIDLGCIPGETWSQVGNVVQHLVAEGFRVSVDSFNRHEVTSAVEHGAELVLSVNQENLSWARELPVEFVAIPDVPDRPETLQATAAAMQAAGRKVRWDPILEPIGFGFAASLQRYFRVRQEFPDVPMMMGIGNVTELSEVDSAGLNFLLAAICEELQIGSVLTTEVIPWCQTAVREFDAARRFVRYSISQRRLPKHLDGRLLLLREARQRVLGDAVLTELHSKLTDPNFRIFAERGEIHIFNRQGYWRGDDPYEVFDRLLADVGEISSEHAFYLGMELMKARTALTLGKNYRQDEALRWGMLTVEENSAIARRKKHRTADGTSTAIRPAANPLEPDRPDTAGSDTVAAECP